MALKFIAPFRPTERKDYTCDWSAEMSDTSDTITTATFTLPQSAADGGLEIFTSQVSTDGTKAVMWLKSNDPDLTRLTVLGQNIVITHTIETVYGRHLTQTLQIKVSEG